MRVVQITGSARDWARWIGRGVRLAVAVLLLGGLLAACQRDKGDPAQISREFIIAVWQGNVERVKALTCKDWQDVTAQWVQDGDPTVTLDTDHLTFEVSAQSDKQALVTMGGIVTFKMADGQTEVRNMDDLNITHFTLVDEYGWKVCDVR